MVQTQQYNPGAAAPDPWGIANGRSIPSFKFSNKDQYGNQTSVPVGTSYIGRLAENVTSKQARNFDTQEPEYWDEAKTQAKWQIEAIFDTNYRDPAEQEDDGKRRYFFSNQSLRALQDEMRRLGIQRFGVGTVVQITLVDMKATQRGFPQKIYAVTLSEVQPFVSDEEQQTQQAMAAPVAPGAQQQWAQPAAAAPPVQQAPVQAVQQAPVQAAPPVQQAPATPPAAPAAPPYQTQQGSLVGVPAGAPAVQAAGYTEVAQAPAQTAAQAAQLAPAPQAAPAGVQPTQDHVNAVNLVMSAGIDRATAIAAVSAREAAGDPAFAAVLDTLVPF
jgi:hypothetical protein